MIIICVFTDLFASLALIMEKEEYDLMSQPPRNPKKDHLINLKIVSRLMGKSVVYRHMLTYFCAQYCQSYLFIGVMETIIAHSMQVNGHIRTTSAHTNGSIRFFLYYWRAAKIPASALFLAFNTYKPGFYGYTEAELTHFNVTGQASLCCCLMFGTRLS